MVRNQCVSVPPRACFANDGNLHTSLFVTESRRNVCFAHSGSEKQREGLWPYFTFVPIVYIFCAAKLSICHLRLGFGMRLTNLHHIMEVLISQILRKTMQSEKTRCCCYQILFIIHDSKANAVERQIVWRDVQPQGSNVCVCV